MYKRQNPDCQAKKIKSFTLFVSRDALNIDGLSEATLEKFIQAGFIHELSLIHICQYKRELKALSYAFIAVFFGVVLGGRPADCLGAAVIGGILGLVVYAISGLGFNDFCVNGLGAFTIGIAALAMNRWILTGASNDAVSYTHLDVYKRQDSDHWPCSPQQRRSCHYVCGQGDGLHGCGNRGDQPLSLIHIYGQRLCTL